MQSIIYDRKEFRPYDDHYYVSADGEIYSTYINRTLKQNFDADGYPRVDIHSKHMKVHKLVYLTWVGPIPVGCQVNHRNDDKTDNRIENLYAGSQKQNIADCATNRHRIGHSYYLTVSDKQTGKTLTFLPAARFQDYSGHRARNGHISRMFGRNWFKRRYELIEYRKVENIEHRKGVTTMGDECNPVGQSLSLTEAHDADLVGEEIV